MASRYPLGPTPPRSGFARPGEGVPPGTRRFAPTSPPGERVGEALAKPVERLGRRSIGGPRGS